MRFISPYTGYRIIAIHEEIEILASGLPRLLSPGYTVEFQRGDVNDHDRRIARERFAGELKRFQVMNMDGTMRDMIDRIAAFDSSFIKDDSLRKRVETALLENPSFGRDYILVTKPETPLPYPTYAKHRKIQGKRTIENVIADVSVALNASGISPQVVIDYERDHLDANSPSLVTAMERLQAPEPEEELVAA